eukprot:3708011-Pleurochrysis_carterae.AAC.2
MPRRAMYVRSVFQEATAVQIYRSAVQGVSFLNSLLYHRPNKRSIERQFCVYTNVSDPNKLPNVEQLNWRFANGRSSSTCR